MRLIVVRTDLNRVNEGENHARIESNLCLRNAEFSELSAAKSRRPTRCDLVSRIALAGLLRTGIVEKATRGKRVEVGGTCLAYRFESSPSSSFLSVPATGNRGTR